MKGLLSGFVRFGDGLAQRIIYEGARTAFAKGNACDSRLRPMRVLGPIRIVLHEEYVVLVVQDLIPGIFNLPQPCEIRSRAFDEVMRE